MAELFEAFMVISFGISWPTSIIKSYTSGTAKGKSIVFLLFILFVWLFLWYCLEATFRQNYICVCALYNQFANGISGFDFVY